MAQRKQRQRLAKVQHEKPQQKSAVQPSSAALHSSLVAQYTTKSLLRSVVERILNIQYDNYTVFGRNAADIEFARLDQQQEHESFVRETVDIVEQEANTWEFAAQLDVAAGERLTQINRLLQDVMTAKTVGIAKLRRVFTDEQLEAYEQSLQQPIMVAEIMYADDKPAELTHYNKMLREADFMNSKYESMRSSNSVRRATSNHGALSRTQSKAESLYENA